MDPSALTIYNFPPMKPRWDRIGIFYVAFGATWTFIVLCGMAFCWFNRHLPILRVRGLPLFFGSIICLHSYWMMAQIVYPIGGTLPVVIAYDVQYFVMGMWFPLGIALFHAANLRFLRVAKLQKQFINPNERRKAGCNGAHTSVLCRIRNMEYTSKVMSSITIGIVIQCMLCVGMWFACKKYHPTFGLSGTEIRGSNVMEQLVDLGRGWEWWPSVLWQLIWTWMVAPFLIVRAWGIRDTMGWRTQTIGACLAGLHATPMFLIASYVPAFAKVNAYYAPSQWIHLTTMIIEIFTIFVPAIEVIKIWHLSKRVTNNNAKWENESSVTTLQVPNGQGRKGSTFSVMEKEQIFSSMFNDGLSDRLFTMTALNRVLDEQPAPLQEFSAYHDFSGENIAFLTRVAKWKQVFANTLTPEKRSAAFNSALVIYADFISPRDAEFPLNLSSAHLKEVETVFESSVRILYGAARFDPFSPLSFDTPVSRASDTSEDSADALSRHARWTGEIPPEFNVTVFDEVQSHIKQLVLTNTWPKFVIEMQVRRRRSVDSDRSDLTDASDVTVVSQVTKFVRQLGAGNATSKV